MKIGITCEGPLDFIVLKEFIEQVAQNAGAAIPIIECLQPAVDATSGRYGHGGWGHVKNWCENHTNGGLATYFDAPLFAGQTPFDYLIIHIDGDVIECLAPGQTTVALPSTAITVSQRVALAVNIVEGWLAPTAAHHSKVRTCVPVLQTESWLIAALSNNHHAWEAISSKPVYLAELGSRKRRQENYRNRAKEARSKLEDIRQRCVSFALFEPALIAIL